MTGHTSAASAERQVEEFDPGELGKLVMEHRVSRIVAWVCWPLVLLSAGLLLLGIISFFTSSEFKSDSLLLFGILLMLATASLATGLSAVRTRFAVYEEGVVSSGLFGSKTVHFKQIADMSVSRNQLANLRRPFNALKPHLVIRTKDPQPVTYRICPFLISDFAIFDAAVDRWTANPVDDEPIPPPT